MELAMTDDDRKAWEKTDEPLEIRVSGISTPLFLKRKRFKTGSIGWYLSQKAVVSDTPVQLSMCITVIGSKPVAVDAEVNKTSALSDELIQAMDIRDGTEANGAVKKARKRS